MSNDPTLKDFLTGHPALGDLSPGTAEFIRLRHLCAEHLVNRHRARTEELVPLRVFEYEARLQGHLDTETLTFEEYDALCALCEALTAGGHPAWEELVLERLGVVPVPAEGLTNFLRCVLVHVFRHGHAPDGQPWCHSPGAATGALLDMGHLRKTGAGLELTDTGVAAAGVLEPVSVHLHAGQWLATDSDAYAVLVGPVREKSQTIVRLVEVGA